MIPPLYRSFSPPIHFIRQTADPDWRNSSDRAWGTVTRARRFPEDVTFVGQRMIEGVLHNVFNVSDPELPYEAQTADPAWDYEELILRVAARFQRVRAT